MVFFSTVIRVDVRNWTRTNIEASRNRENKVHVDVIGKTDGKKVSAWIRKKD